ncbi:Zn-ribbon domain-containing OB-fold protein [Seohaeicola sp. SP36]|uniref:Zn-ribbon domain-containing OB-fold protein n=1 Tax=unclassified Seohaeicola TaxID=2641111 RepID=UPI00237B6A50|nr:MULTISPECIES: Zn-ribbon domain-containing OB-fold protein [unclassified Seohaeicola]MDD9707992.1 Zn-ribbon domain-containing OB-fold protein [Seohaeicola sp. 4SK31]MDD9736755.1 Zn-ribbon domain-containing OB-fold protein [Seohaeicola sp. SP36]
MSTEKPLPVIDHDSAPYWEAARAGRLDIPLCGDCGKHHFYPRAICPYCHSDKLRFDTVSGRGKVHTFTIARRPAGPAFADDVPYVVALIELEEGPRMMSRIETDDPEKVRIGAKVEVTFVKASDEVTFPYFRMT